MHVDPSRSARVSVAQQFRHRHDWGHWFRQRQAYFPCWLASFVLHMALTILLASLILPQVKDPLLRPLLLSFAAELVDAPRSEPQPVVLDHEEPNPRGVEEPQPVADPPAAPPPVEQPAEAKAAPEPDNTAIEPTVPPAQVAMADPFAVFAARGERPARFLNASTQAAPAAELPAALDSGPLQTRFDEIVDRFILYDIGRLTGAAGTEACRDFQSLGPNAIPALVRGLNRSASIHASCPVCVITDRLQSALAKNRDRSMFSYAITNIGRDVPENAPHYGRLMSFADSLKHSSASLITALEDPDPQTRVQALEHLLDQRGALKPREKQQLAEALVTLLETEPAMRLAAHRVLTVLSEGQPGAPAEQTLNEGAQAAATQWRSHWRRIEECENLKRAAPHELHAGLKSVDTTVQQAAAQSIVARKPRMTDGQRLFLARELIGMLSAPDALTGNLADQALSVLADQDRPRGFNPHQWSTFWDNLEREKLIGPRADAYLSMARRLESRGQIREARNRYDKIVADFPHTSAATQARERLTQLASNR